MSLISVIIPCYNSGKSIARTLQSCLVQREYLKEIIVVDDGSSDDSRAVVAALQKEYPQLIKLVNNETKGGNNARNLGFSLAEGAFIQWLDADDLLLPGKWKAQLAYFEVNPSIDIVYSDWRLDTYEGDVLVREEEKKNAPVEDFLFELLSNRWSAPHCYLLRRAIARRLFELEAWNPRTAVLQDREYFTVGGIIGGRYGYVEGVYAVYNRWNKSSVSAAGADARYLSLERLLTRFDGLLSEQSWIGLGQLLRYRHVIDTERLLIRASGYAVVIPRRPLGWKELEWELVGGGRTSVRFILQYIKWRYLNG